MYLVSSPFLLGYVTDFSLLIALVYNGINSTIDSFRGKHDTAGSMAAGALTGALYKSTGTNGFPQPLCLRSLIKKLFSVSRGKTRSCSSISDIGSGRDLELREEERMIDCM